MNADSRTSVERKGSQAGNAGTTLKGLLAALGVLALITTALYMRAALSDPPPERAPLPVDTVVYQVRDSYQRDASYLGLVTAGRKTDLGFEIGGTLDNAPPRPGSPVEAGDVIGELDQSSLLAQRDATAAQLEQARVELQLARLNAERQKALIDSGAVSREAYDDTRLRSLALESRVQAMAAQLRIIEINLEKSRLLAPYSGVIADRYADQGAVVNPGTAVVRLVETRAREAHIGVPAGRAATLEVGQQYLLTVRETTFPAELLSIRPDINARTRTTTAVFGLPDAVAAMDGESVLLTLEETVPRTGGWLPMDALQEGKRGLWMVLVVDTQNGEHRAVREAVEIIEVRGNQVFVHGSLPANSLVIASGVHRVSAGARVQPAATH
ncbi:MAG: efflux RND transporter periplasmic adaptor subunit [Halioglobus sp.]|nr:efflux RND transporter periplasmic adaptor subunit [Halioglobus sp.]